MMLYMWVLVLMLDPVNFNPEYRTPKELEIGERAFFYEFQCHRAAEALTWGVPIGLMTRGYQCVWEKTWVRNADVPTVLESNGSRGPQEAP